MAKTGEKMIKGTPFNRKEEEKQSDHITLKLNSEEREYLELWKKVIRQPKDSTAIKQMALIGSKVVLSSQTREILEVVFNNKRRNKRLGITEF